MLDQPLAIRRGRRQNRQPPMRYRDVFPDPPAVLPPPPSSLACEVNPLLTLTPPPPPPPRKLLRSSSNKFGLFRQYYATQFPEHDPDGNIPKNLLDTTASDSLTNTADSILPYPTLSSFLLGEWYWNDGLKKSQSSFANLIKVVGHPEFRPEDVSNVNWKLIDTHLGGSPDSEEVGDDWEDDSDDTCNGNWTETPIKINVPFHSRMRLPGQEEFGAGKLHHRKLVSVIRDKLSRSDSKSYLHLEPYELYWQPDNNSQPMKVHGELYSSTAFVEAHRILQDSPPEPGCDLPRFIIGMMFASDGTQLTSFSNAKLWPVYLAFGNESKYRRSKPSCQAFEHIAYFESVGFFPPLKLFGSNVISSRIRSSLLQQIALVGKGQTVPL